MRLCGVRRLGIIVIGLFILAAPATGQNAQSANQLWFDGQYVWPAGEKVSLAAVGSARLGRGMNHFVYERAGAMVAFKVFPMLTLTPSYNYLASQPIAGENVREQRFAIDATPTGHLGRFQLGDRNRFEWRVMPTTSYFRYMNRLQILHPLTLEGQHLNVWIADEVFYDGNLHLWSRNRFSTGISRKVSAAITVDLYYLRQNDHYSHPGDINAFGVSLKAAHK